MKIIEVIVVFIIIIVLILLLIPAVQKVRDAAARTASLNKPTEIGQEILCKLRSSPNSWVLVDFTGGERWRNGNGNVWINGEYVTDFISKRESTEIAEICEKKYQESIEKEKRAKTIGKIKWDN